MWRGGYGRTARSRRVARQRPPRPSPAGIPTARRPTRSRSTPPDSRVDIGGQQPKTQHRIAVRTRGADRVDQADAALGQGAGLVGDQDVDVAEVFDTHQPFDQHFGFGQLPRPGRQAGADHRGQQLRRDADRDRQREQHRIDHRLTQQQVADQDQHRQRDRDLQQQIGELAQADLKVGLRLPLTQTGRDAPELRISAGGVHHPDPLAGADDRAHERQIGGFGQLRTGRHRLGRLLRARRFPGQDAFVAFQTGDLDQSQVRGYGFAQRQPDHVTGNEFGDIDGDESARRGARPRCGAPPNARQQRPARRGTR